MYYNSDGEKCNIDIFSGKQAKKDVGILTRLMRGSKTTMELSKLLAEKHPKTTYSIIARKGGSLDRLESMHFIKRDADKKWSLTLTGLITASLYDYDPALLRTIFVDFQLQPIKKDFSKVMAKMPFFKMVDPKALKHMMDVVFNDNAIIILRDITIELIKEGWDIKKVDDQGFLSVVTHRYVTRMVQQLDKETKKIDYLNDEKEGK